MKAINSKKSTPVITLSLCVFIIIVQWSVVVSTAHAQEESSTRIDEIIITAQRRAESIQDVPITLNVYSSEALENLRIDDIDSLARNVPAFTTGMTRTNVPIHTIRGIGFDGVKTSSQSSVGVTMDEVSYTVPFMTKGVMFDLERVEILKGPQGTLFGRNTTAGLVQYIAAKPTDEFEGSVSATIGNYETFNTGGYVSGPLSNTLRGRLAFKKLDSSKGWQKSVTRGDRLGEKDMLSLRGTLEWDATERLQTRLMLNYWRDRSDTVALQLLDFRPGLPPSFPLPSEIFDSTVSGGDNEDADWIPRGHDAKPADLTRFKKDDPRNFDTYFFSPTLYLDYRISDDIAFHSVTAYQRLNRDSFSDYDGTALELQNAEQTAEVRSWQQEFRLSGDYARGNWTAGVYFSDDEMYDSRIAWFGDNPLIEFTRVFGVTVIPQLIDAGVLPGPLPHSIEEISVGMRTADIFGKQERESWAVFFDGNYKVTDGITLTAGIRYSDDRTDFEGCTLDRFNNFAPTHNVSVAFFNGAFPLNVGPGECTNLLTDSEGVTGETGLVVNKVDEDNVSGRLTLDWQLAENVLIYGSVSRGFKSGQFVPVGASLDVGLFPVTQERLQSFEVGVKATIGSVLISASGYYYDFKDKQIAGRVADETFGVLNRLVNIPESTVKGAEADITWNVTSQAWLRTLVAYTKAEVDGRFDSFGEFGDPIDLDGKEFPYTPDIQLNIQGGIEVPISEDVGLRAIADWAWQSEHEGNITNNPEAVIDSYGLLNASIGLYGIDRGWSGTLWVKNATDKDYPANYDIATGAVSRVMGMPRIYGLTLKYNF